MYGYAFVGLVTLQKATKGVFSDCSRGESANLV